MGKQAISSVSTAFAANICHRIATSHDVEDCGRLELDSHADSPVVGNGAVIVRKTGRQVSVKGFADEIGRPISVPVVDALLTYCCEFTGEMRLCMIRNALHVPSMNNHLIPPFMMRLAGLEVNECAKFLAKSPGMHHHSVYFPSMKYRIPLSLSGITSYIPTQVPTKDEIEQLEVLELTPQFDSWNPHSKVYQDQEDSMMDYKGELKEPTRKANHLISSTALGDTNTNVHCVSNVIDRALELVLLAEDLIHRRYCSNVEYVSFG